MLITGHCQLSYIQTQQHLAGNSDFYESNKQDWESSLLLETNWWSMFLVTATDSCCWGGEEHWGLRVHRISVRLGHQTSQYWHQLTEESGRSWGGRVFPGWLWYVTDSYFFWFLSYFFGFISFIHSGDYWIEGTEVIQDINKRLFVESNYI